MSSSTEDVINVHQTNGIDLGSNSCSKFMEARADLQTRVINEDVLVGPYEHKTQLIKRINSGAFGQIFLGRQIGSGQKVAVKIEHPGPGIEQLLYEGQVYRKLDGGPGIPRVLWYGMHGDLFNALVMELLGPSIQELFVNTSHKFSLKTVLLLLDQMLSTIGFIHSCGFVHRDLSTSNFMMSPDLNQLYLVDYGLAKQVKSSPSYGSGKLGARFTFRMSRPMVGTARFCSTFCHRGEEASRRDDMESLAYIWLYLLKGSLPWQGLQSSTVGGKLDRISSMKLNMPVEKLCEGLPQEFETYFTFVRGMNQFDNPDYSAIKKLFRSLAAKEDIAYDFCYDWLEQESETSNNNMRRVHNTSTSSSSPSEGIVSH